MVKKTKKNNRQVKLRKTKNRNKSVIKKSKKKNMLL